MDWFADQTGTLHQWRSLPDASHPERLYRLYRFLSDLEDVLDQTADDRQRLARLGPMVRRLLQDAPWLVLQMPPPDVDTGWSVMMLYDEPDYPITVQMVSWAPGSLSPIHNHGTWGIVALLSGQERNRFWRSPRHLPQGQSWQPCETCTLEAEDMLLLMPDTIHQVEALGVEPTVSFNVYGETRYDQRFEFDVHSGAARNF